MDLKEKIINYAKSINIDLIGFTTAEPFDDLKVILEKRKTLGYLSGFEEKDLELRIDPKKTMKDAKTIIVIGISYFVDDKKIENKDKSVLYGEMSRTARGKDYHEVLIQKLHQLARYIEALQKDFKYKAFVDKGPLVDRHIAYRAGLGWYGYNSLLINQIYGSWIFIGYMLNNIEIEADEPLHEQKCKRCNLCITHCPGGAIEEPYLFNASKCISNILQQKYEISEENRKKIGKKIYGCDVCQNICPHNNEVRESTSDEFIPYDIPSKIDLTKLLCISNKEFADTYGKNASGWRGKKILQRNAIIAMANHQKQEAISFLIPMLKDVRPEIRKYAIWALSNLEPQKTCEYLKEVSQKGKD